MQTNSSVEGRDDASVELQVRLSMTNKNGVWVALNPEYRIVKITDTVHGLSKYIYGKLSEMLVILPSSIYLYSSIASMKLHY